MYPPTSHLKSSDCPWWVVFECRATRVVIWPERVPDKLNSDITLAPAALKCGSRLVYFPACCRCNLMDDTIAAIATPIGEGGIAIIRVSGPQALAVADAVFEAGQKKKPSTFASHTIHFGQIVRDGQLVDQVLLSVMRAPRTYTAEDVVEINCHGGLLTARSILAMCLQAGARLAEPGEFTKRAFLNGRLDLAQAEAVMDLISAKSVRAQTSAANALDGHLSRRVEQLREKLMGVLAHVEAHIDFPEDDIAADTRESLVKTTGEIATALDELLATAQEGKILRQGISIAIIGRPNVGKSSLMNALLGEDRSIVTSVPGTTRDTVEEYASINGIPVQLIDTAGIRTSRGKVENIGIGRSYKTLEQSDLRILILDSSRPLSTGDEHLYQRCAGLKTIIVQNKVDLNIKLKLPVRFSQLAAIRVSCLTGEGVKTLKDAIEESACHTAHSSKHADVTINDRHKDALRRASSALTTGTKEMTDGRSLEIVAQSYRVALSAVGEVVGRTTTEDLLSRIFSTFCIGK